MANNSITLALTGASGLQYGIRLLECLLQTEQEVNLLLSQAAYAVAAQELDLKLVKQTSKLKQVLLSHFKLATAKLQIFDQHEWSAPIASGSNASRAMVVCPCSSGTLAAIAHGFSNNLIERAADVIIKEKRQLILVPRETPLSLIHVENMRKLLTTGVVIMPASPGFYQKPTTINDLIDFMVARVLDHLGIEHHLVARWGD
jgi:flavin prenyltransferase